MATKKADTNKSRGAKNKSTWLEPHWVQSEALLGSAVRYVSGISSKFNWVGVYLLSKDRKNLVLGPYIGAKTDHTKIPVGKGVCGTAVKEGRDQNVPDVREVSNYLSCSLETRSELVVLIRKKDRAGKEIIVGQIDIDSHTPDAFGSEEERLVKQVALELGERWPE